MADWLHGRRGEFAHGTGAGMPNGSAPVKHHLKLSVALVPRGCVPRSSDVPSVYTVVTRAGTGSDGNSRKSQMRLCGPGCGPGREVGGATCISQSPPGIEKPLASQEVGSWCKGLSKSGRLDLNQRPPAPEAGALPGYATPRSSCKCAAGAPGRTRTSNLLIRSQMLYPIELRAPSNDVGQNTKRRNTTHLRAAQRRWQVAESTQAHQLGQGRRRPSDRLSTTFCTLISASLGAPVPSLDGASAGTTPNATSRSAAGSVPIGSDSVNRDPCPT